MKLNRTTFYATVRAAPFGGRLATSQVDGMNAILDYWERSELLDVRFLAYILATAFHETAATMQPVRETLASSDKQAVDRLNKAFNAGKLGSVKTRYWTPDANGLSWFGRGLVQLTHKPNYVKMGGILGIPLSSNPSLALDLETSVAILFEGMTRGVSSRGDFTGKSLEDYFNATIDDPIGARAIVNGTDQAKLIAGYYRHFLAAIKQAIATYIDDGRKKDYIAPEIKKEDAQPDDVPAAKSKSLWAILAALFTSGTFGTAKEVMDGGSSLLGAVSNPWALIAFLAIVAGGILAFLIYTGRITINRSKAAIK